jgi:hypothetical protein
MKVSVIIPTFNRPRTLRATLKTLIEQDFDHSEYEILVVDNNSTDDTPAVVRELQARSPVRLRYLHEPRPGVHYARNLAAVNASGRVLYYTDDDMIADRTMLSELYKVFDLDPLVACATGRVLPKWEVDPPDWVVKYCANGILSLQLRLESLIVSHEDPGVWSCHEAILKDVLIECGGFNPENTEGLWVGDGESGLNAKVEARGYKFGFVGSSVTHHVIPPGRMTQRYLNKRMENQGNADTFTWFRTARPDTRELIGNERTCIRNGMRAMLAAAKGFAKGRDSWHVDRAQVSYWRARFSYCRRLRRDFAWREFVMRDDWIAEAQ